MTLNDAIEAACKRPGGGGPEGVPDGWVYLFGAWERPASVVRAAIGERLREWFKEVVELEEQDDGDE